MGEAPPALSPFFPFPHPRSRRIPPRVFAAMRAPACLHPHSITPTPRAPKED